MSRWPWVSARRTIKVFFDEVESIWSWPGVRFSKVPVTFQTRSNIFKSNSKEELSIFSSKSRKFCFVSWRLLFKFQKFQYLDLERKMANKKYVFGPANLLGISRNEPIHVTVLFDSLPPTPIIIISLYFDLLKFLLKTLFLSLITLPSQLFRSVANGYKLMWQWLTGQF